MMKPLSLSEIVVIFFAGILFKCLGDITGVYPHLSQLMCLWGSYLLMAFAGLLLACNRWWYWRHRHDVPPEASDEK
ncbi:hypothetical protein FEI17_27205 (plasmid) [Kosakonia radicincitans]|uniref:hypothetical protein n=1 Tax=Kosakonia TaxID=1330547 RepID=UPI0011EC6A39|nr:MULTISPECIES: hypothetical protein [Kosakonia]QEM94320.1 hypothetical protein FEI17_27205 [Kosakonia radicincitans]